MTEMWDNTANLSTAQQRQFLIDLLSARHKRVFPLSLAQQGLWFLNQLDPGTSAYNVSLGIRLRGNLDRLALGSSLQAIVHRHEILRTTFGVDAGRPIQIVAPDLQLETSLVDLTDADSNERQSEAYRIAAAEVRIPFDLAAGPLLRVRIIRLSGDEHLLICILHHIVSDGWSLEIFIRELASFYGQYSEERKTSIVDLPLQYGDYAKWQQEWISGDFLVKQARYWKQKLAGAAACLHLPTDYPRPAERSYDGASCAISAPKELIHNLAAVGRKQQATLFMVMLAAFKALLYFYTGAEDILVGVPVAGRNRVEVEQLIGFFVNTVAVRTNLAGDPDFIDLLVQVREATLDAFAHDGLPFEKVVEVLNPTRSLSYTPVVQVMFSAVKIRTFPKFGDVVASPYVLAPQTSLFDLTMNVIEDAEERWWLQAEYATSLFEQGRMVKMLKHYLTLLTAIAARPQLRVSELASVLDVESYAPPPKEGAASLGEGSGTGSYYEIGRSHPDDRGEPRDALEQILVRIWERVLGTSKIRVSDDFFDLGGHSLLAAHLVSEVEKAVGRKIPLSALFRGSSVQSLAELIRRGTAWSPDPLVVEIHAGNKPNPLFAVAESGVDTLGYALLARHLEADQPFYKLQAHASTCHIVPYSIEELRTIAQEYISAMRTIQSEGPYFLVGMCNGAHIAEQMALELEGQGQEVGFIVIIDTFVLQHSEIRWLAFIEGIRNRRRWFSSTPLSYQLSHYKKVVKRRLSRLLRHETEPLSPWTKAVWPGKDFHAQHFRAPVLLFKRAKQPYFKIRDQEMGWGARSAARVRVCAFNVAMHEEMLREPAVGMLAAKLQEALAEHRSDMPQAVPANHKC